jgi:hypothetical protein
VCKTNQYETQAPTPTTDRTCTNSTACKADEYESSPPTPTTGRICYALTVCETEATPPTPTSDRVCSGGVGGAIAGVVGGVGLVGAGIYFSLRPNPYVRVPRGL